MKRVCPNCGEETDLSNITSNTKIGRPGVIVAPGSIVPCPNCGTNLSRSEEERIRPIVYFGLLLLFVVLVAVSFV